VWCYFLTQNSFPLSQWHEEHMEKIVLKFITGLSPTATNWEKRMYKRYGKLANVCRQINYDIKQGATKDQVLVLLDKIRNNSSFSVLRAIDGSLDRLEELENEFLPDKKAYHWY
jgi:hypothetical protein